MTTLCVAAGGGGDALGILLARRVLDPEAIAPALVSTCAWERLRIDPVPGPRLRSDFTGLGAVGGTLCEIVASTDTRPAGRSMIPRLAAETDAGLFLHDFGAGARGLARQVADLAAALDVDSITVLDVGGDVIARGNEPTLLSPLADSLTLAATIQTGIPTRLAVLGPGIDGELAADEVTNLVRRLGGARAGALSPEDVTPLRHVLGWHPTEATTIAAAAALGVRGAVDMRRGQTPTPITNESAAVWIIEQPQLDDFPLAAALGDTANLDQAETLMRTLAVDELDYERQRAADRRERPTPTQTPEELAMSSRRRGATHITTRRLLEASTGDLEGHASARVAGLGLWDLDRLTPARAAF